MRQNDRPAVAPLNTAPQWPEGYISVLRGMGALEKTIPYCVVWVRRFFARFPGRRRRDLGRAEIEAFLSEICRQVSNWQLAQARSALETYYEQFRGIPLAPRPDRTPRDAPTDIQQRSSSSMRPPSPSLAKSLSSGRVPPIVPPKQVRRYSSSRMPVNAIISKTKESHART